MTWKKKWGLTIGLLLLTVTGLWLVFARAGWQLAQYRAKLVAQGVKLTVPELLPPWLAPEENAGFQLEILSRDLNPGTVLPEEFVSSMRFVAPGRARVAWQQAVPLSSPVKNPAHSNWTWVQARAAVDAELDSLAQIREVLARPHLDLRLNYLQGYSLLLPHLARHKALAQLLARTVVIQLHAGDLAAAADNLHALLVLAHRQSEEPLLISQLIQMSMAQIGLAATWEALQAPGWSEPQLARFQRDWETLKFSRPMQRAAAMERAITLVEFERARRSLKALDQIMGAAAGQGGVASLDGLEEAVRRMLWLWYGSYLDERHYLEVMESVSSGFDEFDAGLPLSSVLNRQKEFFAQFRRRAWLREGVPAVGYLLSLQVVSSWEDLTAKMAYAETARRLVATALACARYRLANGKMPPELAALAPAFLAAVPRDPLDGQPLRYRSEPSGAYLLYSVGEDGRDDGGDGQPASPADTPLRLNAGKDWVWPAAATPEEVAADAQKKR